MSRYGIFDKERTVDCIKELARMYFENSGTVPRILIAVGGTAMVLRDLRATSEDVDIFVIDEELIRIAAILEQETGYSVDVTTDRCLWGPLRIYDIEEDASVMEKFELAGHKVSISAISPETLFIIKATSLREKDRDDLELIWPHVDPQALMARVGCLFGNQENPFYGDEMVINVAAEIMVMSRAPLNEDYFELVPDEVREQIMQLVDMNFSSVMHHDLPRMRV